MNLKRFLIAMMVTMSLMSLMACAHSVDTPAGDETMGVQAGVEIEFDYADEASLLVISPVEKQVLSLKDCEVGKGKNRILIVGVQVEEGGVENVGDMVISKITCGDQTLMLLPGSEVQLSSMWRGKEYFLKVAVYYLIHPPSGEQDITVTFAGPVTSANIGAISLSNAKSPEDQRGRSGPVDENRQIRVYLYQTLRTPLVPVVSRPGFVGDVLEFKRFVIWQIYK